MLKKLCIVTAFITLITCTLHAQHISVNQDTLINIITHKKDRLAQQKRLIRFIKYYFQSASATQTSGGVDTMQHLFSKYGLPDREAFGNFARSLYLNKHHDLKNAEVHMLGAIQQARKNNDTYLLYQFLSHLSFIQTDLGNFTGAVYSYRLAKKKLRGLTIIICRHYWMQIFLICIINRAFITSL